jgi:hypothetical protein
MNYRRYIVEKNLRATPDEGLPSGATEQSENPAATRASLAAVRLDQSFGRAAPTRV